jgi:hypothetical protein
MSPIVPVGHYLGPIHNGTGAPRHVVRVGRSAMTLASDAEAVAWLAAHGVPDATDPWTRERIAATGGTIDDLLAAGLLAETADAGFPDRYRLMPLFTHDVPTDEPLARLWEYAPEHPTLRAACAAAGAPLDEVTRTGLHRLLAVTAAYLDETSSR